MSTGRPKSLPRIGFLTVWEDPDLGLMGGYLMLNALARPLEFHCTAPVKPNRAQQILYGPTLKPFLYGEQIGHALLHSAKHEPLLVCTDVADALAVRPLVHVPVLLVLPAASDNVEGGMSSSSTAAEGAAGADGADGSLVGSAPQSLTWGRQRAGTASGFEADGDEALRRCAGHVDIERFDWMEPFSRIREAIQEAQRTAGPRRSVPEAA